MPKHSNYQKWCLQFYGVICDRCDLSYYPLKFFMSGCGENIIFKIRYTNRVCIYSFELSHGCFPNNANYNVYINKILWIFIIIPVFKYVTWQVMQLSLLQIGHLKLLMLSLMKHHPSQSGVLQWNEFLEVAWTSFNDFCWCFSNTAGDTSY